MKVLCVGGGSGGHVTPVLAVINELALRDTALSVSFVTDKVFFPQAKAIMRQANVPVTMHIIQAGKFRRYMDMALWKQVMRPDIGGRNFVDMFKVAGGVTQSIRLLRRIRPDVVFAKGGYVSLPVGYAAHLLRIPLVIHDSDTRPGLTNRVLSRWAEAIATGSPVENYRYNAERTHYTGVPIGREFHIVTLAEQRAAKEALGFRGGRPLVVAAGGGLGAKEINDAFCAVAPLCGAAGWDVVHVTGKGSYESLVPRLPIGPHYKAVPFVEEGMATLYAAADIIVNRASATSFQEIAASAKPAVLIPNSSLGDQLENAQRFQAAGAACIMSDEEVASSPQALYELIRSLLDDGDRREAMVRALAHFAHPHAARDVAELVCKAVKPKRVR